MADLWFYTCDGKQMEPVDLQELKNLATAGYLKTTDLVWREGMPQWAPAPSVRELSRAFPQPPVFAEEAEASTASLRDRNPAPFLAERPRSASPANGGSALVGLAVLGFIVLVVLGIIAAGVMVFLKLDKEEAGKVVEVEERKQQQQHVNEAPPQAPNQPLRNDEQPLRPLHPIPRPDNALQGAKAGIEPPAGAKNFTVDLAAGAEHSTQIPLTAKGKAEIVVISRVSQPETKIQLEVYKQVGTLPVAASAGVGKDCRVQFLVPTTGSYRIVVNNLGPGSATCTVYHP